MYTYLASPYSSPDKTTMHARYVAARHCAAFLLRERSWVYSPIVHCHDIAVNHSLPRDFEFWQHYNRAMLFPATDLLILAIDGWKESIGVGQELLEAQKLGKMVGLIRPEGKTYVRSPYANN